MRILKNVFTASAVSMYHWSITYYYSRIISAIIQLFKD